MDQCSRQPPWGTLEIENRASACQRPNDVAVDNVDDDEVVVQVFLSLLITCVKTMELLLNTVHHHYLKKTKPGGLMTRNGTKLTLIVSNSRLMMKTHTAMVMTVSHRQKNCNQSTTSSIKGHTVNCTYNLNLPTSRLGFALNRTKPPSEARCGINMEHFEKAHSTTLVVERTFFILFKPNRIENNACQKSRFSCQMHREI